MSMSRKQAGETAPARSEEPKGLSRFEVRGRSSDRALIRSLARRLAEDSPEATRIRNVVANTIASGSPPTGGILAALRRSPLVGADLDLSRLHVDERKTEL
ncbi:hypothetical protein WG926_09050 [Tistrella sp. BH-R2-4]|uniref:Uncharacterized protein n=1 Tax=Tistrella arctica TaxID=3133430 RepID=A0ABU9YI44_9PROT